MSTETADVSLDGLNLPGDEPAGSPRLKGKKLQIGLLVLGVMALEAGVIYFLLPGPSAPAAAGETDEHHEEVPAEEHHAEEPAHEEAHAHAEDSHGGHGGGHGAEPTYSSNETVEVPIDSFSCTNSLASPGSVLHISLDLTATVSGSNVTALTEAVGRAHKARVRQTVERVCRSATLEELSDPDLGVIKRQIREEINKMLRHSYVIDVVISDFKLLEQ